MKFLSSSIAVGSVCLFFLQSLVTARSYGDCNKNLQNHSPDTPYNYTGKVRHLRPGPHNLTLITYEGCVQYCGSGYEAYPWDKVSSTLTTWILPLAGGLLLQAPFESNQFWSTIFLIFRWLGNPATSLMYTLWNIKVTGECSLLLDMSISRDVTPGYKHTQWILRRLWEELSDKMSSWWQGDIIEEQQSSSEEGRTSFSELRDSLYILSVLNQYKISFEPNYLSLFGLLGFALFSREPNDSDNAVLRQKRTELAAALRATRRHGVVPVFISLMWFGVSLGISIYQAYRDFGGNATAHNLALGLLMSWLPVLISCTLVDRNPTNTQGSQQILHDFLMHAFMMRDRQLRLSDSANGERSPLLLDNLDTQQQQQQPPPRLLLSFCGQAREKWHYGVAHSILGRLERQLELKDRGFIDKYERGDFADEFAESASPDKEEEELWHFDIIEMWHMVYAILIVALGAIGAIVISYNTPTVGLGCRSAGYMIFGILASMGLLLEMLGWALHRYGKPREGFGTMVNLLRLVITVFEIVNTAWLVYILTAQTVGIYNSCECRASRWGGGAGYVDFESDDNYKKNYLIKPYWIAGTVLGGLPLLAILYAVYEWCTQSFLWSIDYPKAMRGLMRVRTAKYILFPDTLHHIFIKMPYEIIGKRYDRLIWRR